MSRILLIDDTPEIAELLSFALRDHGHEVMVSGFTGEIDELIAAHRPDALVFDCTAFEMSLSLFDSVRSDETLAELPIVMISDTPEKADASLRRREAAHILLIPKPFTGSHVARAIAQLLEIPRGS